MMAARCQDILLWKKDKMNRRSFFLFLQFLRKAILLFAVLSMTACATASFDKETFRQSGVRNIGVVIGSGSDALLGYIGPIIGDEIVAPLPDDLEKAFNQMVMLKLQGALVNKGYTAAHLKTAKVEWSIYSNITDSPQSYNNLLQKYGIVPADYTVDAILFVEYMLQNKPLWVTAEHVNQLKMDTFTVMYAKAKIWLYDRRTGGRMFFLLNQKGYERVFSHVTPPAALDDILFLKDFPHIQELY